MAKSPVITFTWEDYSNALADAVFSADPSNPQPIQVVLIKPEQKEVFDYLYSITGDAQEAEDRLHMASLFQEEWTQIQGKAKEWRNTGL